MKRSEMLLVIENILFMGTSKLNTLSYESYSQLSEDLLSSLEDYGIKPPIIKEQSFTMLPSGEMVFAVHEWEKE